MQIVKQIATVTSLRSGLRPNSWLNVHRVRPVSPLHASNSPRQTSPSRLLLRVSAMQTSADLPLASTAGPLPVQSTSDQQHPLKLAKRKVALFVAYVGSPFRGLQLQTKSPGGTVEDALQQAIYDMGGILPSNFGTLQKVGWSRSSRTDKGVHALANVLAMKLECVPSSFETDPEGRQLAAAINTHLPPEVRVLSVQRVNGGFDARGFCRDRTYHYYLPASILGVSGNTGGEEQMKLLRECCGLYQGNNPFHNYTKRRLYRLPPAAQPDAGSNNRDCSETMTTAMQRLQVATQDAAKPQASQTAADHVGSSSTVEEDGWEVVMPPQQQHEVAQMQPAAMQQDVADGQQQDPAAMTQQAADAERQLLPRPLRYRWQDEMDPADMLARAHYRYINAITVHDPAPIGPSQTLAVKVAITGSSFMLHQIRHMIGAAVAVARGNLPMEFVAASLCAPARVALPLAPSEVLVLADNSFQPFPTDTSAATTALQSLSGDVLQLRQHGLEARADFEQQVLNPALEQLLDDSVWAEWDEKLQRICWQDDEMEKFVQKGQTWRVQRAAIADAKKQQASEASQ